MFIEHGEYEKLFSFNSKSDIDNWKVSTDASYKICNTQAQFLLTKYNTGNFVGILSTEYNKPEQTKATYTGYANVMSLTQFTRLGRVININLHQFTHFYLKLRGDGRTYMM